MKARGIEQLTPNNHSLFIRLTHLLRMRKSWGEIADDVGIYQIQDLCQWYLDYKTPKADVMKNTGYVHTVPVKVDYKPDSKKMSEQFIAWKRQHDGAVATRLQTVYSPE